MLTSIGISFEIYDFKSQDARQNIEDVAWPIQTKTVNARRPLTLNQRPSCIYKNKENSNNLKNQSSDKLSDNRQCTFWIVQFPQRINNSCSI